MLFDNPYLNPKQNLKKYFQERRKENNGENWGYGGQDGGNGDMVYAVSRGLHASTLSNKVLRLLDELVRWLDLVLVQLLVYRAARLTAVVLLEG
ncbi:hypothetical protein YC2023_011759 [Brassica napus]